jgi:two-component system cell cycle sensor histidine kinase/response regulator CckA
MQPELKRCKLVDLGSREREGKGMSEQERIEGLERELAALRERVAERGDALNRLLADRVVLENLPDVVSVMDREHRLLYLNHTVRGRTVAEMLGTSVLLYVAPDDRERYARLVEESWSSGETRTFEVHTISDLWWETRFVPIKEDGVVVLMLATSVEVTARKRAERALRESESRLRHAISASGMGAWTWDRQSDAIDWDPMLCQIFGIEPQQTPSGYQSYLALIHPDDRARVAASIQRYLETGIYDDLEHRIVRPDGEVRHVLSKGVTTLDEQGQAQGFRGGVFDVTAHKRLEEQLHQVQKMEAVGQLTAGIAHNFNNALSVIIHNAALCREEASVQAREQLEDIEYAAARAAEMVRQLMVFARPEVNARKAAIDVVRSAQRILELCRTTMDRRIEIKLEVEGPVPQVFANAGQIEQVLLNVCLNARDALEQAKAEAPRIVMRLSRGEQGQARIRISDNGPGMDEAVRSRVFEPFFTTKEVGRGTGLGLAMAYSIVLDHQGRIECESRPGAGATFVIDLPETTLVTAAPPGGAPFSLRGGSETILLIDDEAPVRRALRGVLEREGYRVLEAQDGRAGLATLQRELGKIDLILLDRSMPGLPGEVVVTRLLEIQPGIAIALLSGHPGAAPCDPRAVAVLVKPTDRSTLLRTIRGVLDHRNARVSE